jgi:hypothetical protein
MGTTNCSESEMINGCTARHENMKMVDFKFLLANIFEHRSNQSGIDYRNSIHDDDISGGF